jgi:hypothetical protein
MQNALSTIDPTELTIHPLAKKLPSWGKNDERFISLVEDIREHGILVPLRVDAENRILDGREVWKAAKQLQLKTVPIVHDDRDPATVILGAIINRKHYTKGALAYAVFPVLQPAYEAARKRQLENLKKGSARASIQSTTGNIEAFCEFLGFKRDLFFQAKQLHELFAASDKALAEWDLKHPEPPKGGTTSAGRPEDLRAVFEPKVLNGDIGLGAAIAGIAGMDATKGKAREEYGQLSLFDDWIEKSEVRFSKWEKLREDEKRAIGQKIRGMVKAMPEDLRLQFAKAIKEASQAEK